MSEDNRQAFLLCRDGPEETARFYRQAAICYKRAANRALVPPERYGNIRVARGKEYHDMYLEAARDCFRRYIKLAPTNITP